MATSGARNSGDVQERLMSSHQDMVDMKANLSRLRGLADTEKTENAMLQSRLDEQSQLIMMLKQRSDEKGVQLKSLERMNEELVQFRKEATGQLERELSKNKMLDARFNELAENHSEMIKIKDDYKRRNTSLMQENAKLKEDNARLFSKAVQDRDEKIAELDKKLSYLKDQTAALDKQNKELMSMMKANEEKTQQEKAALTKGLNETQEKLKNAESKLKQSQEAGQKAGAELTLKTQSLTKERDEMLDLAMQRGKVVQEKVTENKKLQQKVDEMEKNVREMQLKFEREAMAVNANLQVKRLRAELEEADEKTEEILREYDAYKKHTTQLLDKEKELNVRLRKLVG